MERWRTTNVCLFLNVYNSVWIYLLENILHQLQALYSQPIFSFLPKCSHKYFFKTCIFKPRKYPGKTVYVNVIGTWQSWIAVPMLFSLQGAFQRIFKMEQQILSILWEFEVVRIMLYPWHLQRQNIKILVAHKEKKAKSPIKGKKME